MLIKTLVVLQLILYASVTGFCQVNRYMVFFKDKTGTPYTLEHPEAYLSERALQRRTVHSIAINEEDIPVSTVYLQSLKDDAYKILHSTKWMNGVLVECAIEQAEALFDYPFVTGVEMVAPGERPVAGGRKKNSGKYNREDAAESVTDTQTNMIGLDKMHEHNFRGEGIFIAIMDNGFSGADTISLFKHVFDEERFDAATSYDFVSGGNNVFRHAAHGTNVWSTMAAYKQEAYTGGAFKASFLLFVTEDEYSEYRVEEYNWLFAAERADSAGVDIINTSLGYSDWFDDPTMNYTPNQMDGKTAVITRAATVAANKGILVVVAAGNEGGFGSDWKIITAPADAKNVLSVGAVTSLRTKSSFSSTGPTPDGRIKPDVAALGVSVSIIRADGTLGYANGTSFSSPLVASLMTGFMQKYPDLTADDLLEKVKRSAHQYANPDNLLGYGIPHFSEWVTHTVADETPQEIGIYPNPVVQELIIELAPTGPVPIQIEARSVDGKVIILMAEKTAHNSFRISLHNQPSGLYALFIKYTDKTIVKKILKVH
jgi:serine protease AprX